MGEGFKKDLMLKSIFNDFLCIYVDEGKGGGVH